MRNLDEGISNHLKAEMIKYVIRMKRQIIYAVACLVVQQGGFLSSQAYRHCTQFSLLSQLWSPCNQF
jgi:hypothetical protein